MKFKLIILTLVSILVFNACDQVDPLNSKRDVVVAPVDTTNTNKVLLMEFTGHYCGSCPPAAELAHALHEEYKGKVILLSVHSGDFAKATTKHPTDFKTVIGDNLYKYFTISNNPIATINYKSYDGFKLLNYTRTNLEPKIVSLLNQENPFVITMESAINSDIATIDVATRIRKDGTYDHNLVVYLAEDSIKDWQADYRLNPSDVDDYYHNAVLRGSFNGTFGESFLKGTIAKATSQTKKLSITLKPEWNRTYLRAIAAIIDNKTNEIIQAEEIKLIK